MVVMGGKNGDIWNALMAGHRGIDGRASSTRRKTPHTHAHEMNNQPLEWRHRHQRGYDGLEGRKYSPLLRTLYRVLLLCR